MKLKFVSRHYEVYTKNGLLRIKKLDSGLYKLVTSYSIEMEDLANYPIFKIPQTTIKDFINHDETLFIGSSNTYPLWGNITLSDMNFIEVTIAEDENNLIREIIIDVDIESLK